jgi:hypothetical protein
MNVDKLLNWIYFGTEAEQKAKSWNRDVRMAISFLEEGLYSREEFSSKIIELRRKYGITNYKSNPITSDFNN